MKLWGGRFETGPAEIMEEFNASLPFDKRLYKEDIATNIAHAKMLGKTGIISDAESKAIVKGLKAVLQDIETGKFKYEPHDEDIHTAVERGLVSKIGAAGGKLRTGRSRNDQAVTGLRLYVKNEIDQLTALICDLQEALVNRAEIDGAAIMPGYTHMQKAQPITLGHHLMAYVFMLERDAGRFTDCRKRTDVLILGSGALAGTTFPIDRNMVAEELGFSAVSDNSLDGVADRDFALEFLSAAAITMAHISRFSEELIMWTSREFAFAIMDEAYSTGSSIMPQKRIRTPQS